MAPHHNVRYLVLSSFLYLSNDLLDVPRPGLVMEMVNMMRLHKVVHVRGTPACGKSVLLTMVEQHMVTNFPLLKITRLDLWDLASTDVLSTVTYLK